MLKKLIISLCIIIALAVGGLSAYISTIDWNKHKSKIAQQIESVTGKKVIFEGPVSFSLFPTPYLTAKEIKIYNQTGTNTDQPLAIVREMITDLSWGPLLKGDFEVNNMSLLNPNILIELMPDGKLNWYSEITDYQKDTLDNIDIALNSVMLKDASVQIINKGLSVDVNLQNLNAEITAQSLFGPYRIDGNFIKDNNPAGFALNLGTLSESFATSLNLVLTHPSTESYARFDGSMLTSNNEIKGNFTVESKNPSTFINELTNQVILPTEFNYPLACSIELNTNNQQIDLSSFIIKYGDNTAGSGNILIPLVPKKGEEKRKVEIGFEMTDLDLNPVMGVIKQQLKKYEGEKTPFEPYFDFDMIADIKAVKANYSNQAIRNFNISADLVNDILSIKNLSGLFPGDTDVSVSGDVFENEKVLSYDLKLKGLSQDFLKFLTWLNIKPQTYAPATYRGAQTSLGISGTLDQIKISPLDFTLDKMTLRGVVGIIRGGKLNLFIALQGESINFDNYLSQLSPEEQKLPLSEKFKIILNKFKFLNDIDLHFETKLGLGIYNKTPFEKLNVYFDSKDGVVNIEDFSVGEIASSEMKFSGNLSNLGISPDFENLKYNFKSTDFKSFTDKFELPLPSWPLVANALNVESKGIFTGNLNEASIKAVNTFEQFNSVYSGKLFNQNNMLNYRGVLEFKTPDFTKFVNLLGYDYKPQNIAANIFTFKGTIEGNSLDWKAKNINAFIGSNNFKGNIATTFNNKRPQIVADLFANRFEFDRFIYNVDQASPMVLKKDADTAGFFTKPLLDKTNINYDFFKTFDLNGKFKVGLLNYGIENFENVETDMEIKQSVINVKNFMAEKDKGVIRGKFTLDINAVPKIKGTASLNDFNLSNFGGKKYAIVSGLLKASAEYEAPATSEADFIGGLNGKLSFDIDNAVFKGWDLEFIEDDLSRRTHSDNLFEVLRDNLQKGQSNFELIGAEIDIKNGEYTFKDALMASGLVTVDISGNGNLKNWDTNANFKLIFDRLRDKTVPIEYKWNGPLSSPNLIVDGTSLKNKYDSYWEKIAREKKAAEDARIKALNEKMLKTQEIVVRIKSFMTSEILPKIEKYKTFSINAEIKSKYDSNHLLAIDINNELDAMATKPKQEFNDDDIVEMNAKLETYEPLLNEMLRQIEDNFAFDSKLHAADSYAQIANIYNNSKTKADNYQKTLNAYVLRLLQLQSLVVLDRDPKASDYKNQIETSLRTLEDLNSNANIAKEIIETSDNNEDLDAQSKIMEELLQKSKKELESLNRGLEELFGYAKKLVREEEYGGNPPPELIAQENKIIIIKEDTEKSAEKSSSQEGLLQPTDNTVLAQPQQDLKTLMEDMEQPSRVISYQSKLAPSGSITKGKKVIKPAKPVSLSAQPQAPLLRPITESTVTSGGTIKRK